ncbi:MAG: phosphotransferase [bacterium]
MEDFSIKPYEIKKIQKILETKEVEELIECLKTFEIHAKSIGEGGNAEILAIEEGPFSKVCLKKVKETPQLVYNTIDRENELQGKAHKAGVRTPLALLSIETESGDEFFLMEKIDGINVEEALAQPSKVPDAFSNEPFMKDLDDQIKKMHNAGIYHRDLHVRNVMIDKAGQPVIIDFGTAVEGTGSDFTYEELATVYDEKKKGYTQVSGKFQDDLKMVRNLRSAIIPLARRKLDKVE